MPIKNELKHLIATTVIISMILGGVAGAVAGTVTWTILSRSTSLLQPATTESTATPTAKVTAQAGLVSEVSEEKQTVKVVQGSLPAVVSVIATQELQNLPQSQFYNDFFFNPFGDTPFGQTPQNQDQSPTPQQPEKRQVSAGSGFIVDRSGLVITNKHVVSNTKADYSIVLSTGKTYPAEVIDRDSVQDLAILRIKPVSEEALDFPTISLGNSESVQIGQTVIAIGNTLGEYQNTVTRGIVSGINRTLTAGGVGIGSELIEGAIQTDAAISSGNSGGPLLNLKGEVIGVNTAVSYEGENIGFALSVDQVKLIIDSVKQYGKIVRPFLGVRYILLNEDVAKKNNMKLTEGALVVRGETREELAVIPGSPADKAGIKENDIILEIDGRKITTEQSLQSLLLHYKSGAKVTIKISRAGEIFEKEVVLVDREEL